MQVMVTSMPASVDQTCHNLKLMLAVTQDGKQSWGTGGFPESLHSVCLVEEKYSHGASPNTASVPLPLITPYFFAAHMHTHMHVTKS